MFEFKCSVMVCSKRDVAVRAFVRILLLLAKSYELVLTVNRVSSAEDLRKAYRKLSLKTHPDKGGKKGDQQKLQQAKEAWEKVLLMRVCRLGWKRSFAQDTRVKVCAPSPQDIESTFCGHVPPSFGAFWRMRSKAIRNAHRHTNRQVAIQKSPEQKKQCTGMVHWDL